MADLRRYVASLINRVEAGDVDATLAGRLGYLANILKGIISDSDLEQRLEKLEEEVNKE